MSDINVKIEKRGVSTSVAPINTYNGLLNKPSINGVELKGDLKTEDLNIDLPDTSNFATKGELETKADKSEIPDISNFATKTDLNGYVNTTTDQDVSGTKQLTSGILKIQNKNMQYNVAPSSRQESRIVFKDKNSTPINNICCNRYPNGSTFMEFHTHAQNGSWSQPDTCFRVGHDGSKFVAEVPTPNANSNGRDVATTAWVVSKLGDIESTLDAINGEIV